MDANSDRSFTPEALTASGGKGHPADAGPGQLNAVDGRGPTRRKALRSARSLLIGAAIIFGFGGILVGLRYYAYARSHESTDDAFIEGDIVQISPQVTGHVSTVYVTDNQEVKPGDLLVAIDPRDFEAQLAQARANLAAGIARHRGATISVRVTETTSGASVRQSEAGVQAAQRQVEVARSQVAEARAKVAAADAEAARAAADAQRYERLLQYHAVSRQERDNAVATNRTAVANLDVARKSEQAAGDSLRQAEAQLGQANAQLASAQAAPDQVAHSRAQAEQAAAEIAQAQAAIQQAELDLSYTQISAPVAGRVTRKQVEAGDFVQAGQALMAIVPDRVWVIANFKETQLADIRPGEPVTIRVDAYPDKVFQGHVDSIQAGTGARFSLLPPENATGNYVKVVQRVPVKIVFDEPPDPQHPLGPGMSVVPEVRVR
jgi:membrane fusion protein (multidrug efflux system)